MSTRRLAVFVLCITLVAITTAATTWFNAQWTSDYKRHTTRGACAGQYEEDNTLALYEGNNHAVTGEFELNMAFYSDRNSSARCDESEDSVATLDITYKLQGTWSGEEQEIALNGTLKKCEEDGSYHECDSTPRTMRWTVTRSGSDSVVLKGTLMGISERPLQRYRR